jgi:hypothetical protein
LSALKEVLGGKSKAIAQACRGSEAGVESGKPKIFRYVKGMSHARNARDATGEVK